MSMSDLEDYRWLVSDAAIPWLAAAAEPQVQLVKFAQTLRKQFSALRTHLILEQAELRRRAKEKFARADQLFFTRQSLEQATDDRIASYKASRFEACESI